VNVIPGDDRHHWSPIVFWTPRRGDAGHWPEQAARGRAILAAEFGCGHPLDANHILRYSENCRVWMQPFRGWPSLESVADRTAAIVKQAVRCTARAAFYGAARQA
jgi:hypothetical protein